MVILAVKIASNGAAFGRWNPEIRATCVEDNLEHLWRRADGDLGEVYVKPLAKCRANLAVEIAYIEHSGSC